MEKSSIPPMKRWTSVAIFRAHDLPSKSIDDTDRGEANRMEIPHSPRRHSGERCSCTSINASLHNAASGSPKQQRALPSCTSFCLLSPLREANFYGDCNPCAKGKSRILTSNRSAHEAKKSSTICATLKQLITIDTNER